MPESCSHCDKPAVSWVWSYDHGYVGWCREHVQATTDPTDPTKEGEK